MTPANDNTSTERREAPQPATPRVHAAIQEVQERRLKRRPPQEFDVSALPLFGDQRHQMELFDSRPGAMAAAYAEETGLDYATALVHCNMD